jgi:hypothetical protein
VVTQGQTSSEIHRSIYSSKVGLVPHLTLLFNPLQLVEDEEIIGTLIETNDRIIAALESYDKVRLHHVQSA